MLVVHPLCRPGFGDIAAVIVTLAAVGLDRPHFLNADTLINLDSLIVDVDTTRRRVAALSSIYVPNPYQPVVVFGVREGDREHLQIVLRQSIVVSLGYLPFIGPTGAVVDEDISVIRLACLLGRLDFQSVTTTGPTELRIGRGLDEILDIVPIISPQRSLAQSDIIEL